MSPSRAPSDASDLSARSQDEQFDNQMSASSSRSSRPPPNAEAASSFNARLAQIRAIVEEATAGLSSSDNEDDFANDKESEACDPYEPCSDDACSEGYYPSEEFRISSTSTNLSATTISSPPSSSEGEEEEEPRWTLRLPIYGSIALRRARTRNINPFDVRRWQKFQLDHERELKYGPLADVDTSFRPVDFGRGMQHYSRMARINDGEPISPHTKPRVEQMSLREFREAFGEEAGSYIGSGYGAGEDGGTRGMGMQEAEEELLDYTYVPRLSAPSAEGTLWVDPFRARSSSAGVADWERKVEWMDLC